MVTRNQTNLIKLSFATFGILLATTFLAGTIAINTTANAETTKVDTLNVSITAACTMTRTDSSGGVYTTSLIPGQETELGPTSIKTICNDVSGYAIYAVGFSGNSYTDTTHTDLISTINNDYNIHTNTASSAGSNSYWAMKLASTPSGDYTPTVEAAYTNYNVVPSSYTKVVSLGQATDAGSGATGSNVNASYKIKAAAAQVADTYTGKVKYTLVHPNNASAPETPLNMQSVGTWGSTLSVGDEIEAVDTRDGKVYTVAKLADGNIWMTQNLDHDIVTTPNFYTYANTDIGHGSTPNTSATWTASTATYATGSETWEWLTDAPESYDPGELCWNGNLDTTYSGTLDDYAGPCSEGSHYQIGNYYNWTAAVAMNDSSSYTTDQQDVDQSICPAGWRLPTYSGSKSYDNLVTTLSLTSGTSGNIQNSPVFLPYPGGWTGGSGGVGGAGDFWSSVVNDDFSAYNLFFDADGRLNPQSSDGRGEGFSVRCVAR